MNTKLKVLVVTLTLATGGFYAFVTRGSAPSIPGDLRDALADSAIEQLGSGKTQAAPEVPAGKEFTQSPGFPAPVPVKEAAKSIEWVTIEGGAFYMGTDINEVGFKDAMPVHRVAIKTFQMSKSEVTAAQYMQCVKAGKCTEPDNDRGCTWLRNMDSHPVNCLDWDQANQFARFAGARLPTEAEWEYAATSGGRNQKYPWGNDRVACELAAMDGCGTTGTRPVCSKLAGQTAQGLCDMAGNVLEWVQDKYQDSYGGAPGDGSAYERAGDARVVRGGAYFSQYSFTLRADFRAHAGQEERAKGIGFRLARTGR